MKRYRHRHKRGFERDKYNRIQQWNREHDAGGFKCSHCKQFVIINDIMGTANRNHCNRCFWSKHVDEQKGDRRATCQAGMRPVGLTFKHEGFNKTGELMLIHFCSACPKISINRIARDDPEHHILDIFEQSFELNEHAKQRLISADIYLLGETDRKQLNVQLFGI